MSSITWWNNNTCICYQSGDQTNNYTNYSHIEYNCVLTYSNQVTLENSSTTTLMYETTIRNILFRLNFINKLNPVNYKYNYKSDYVSYQKMIF